MEDTKEVLANFKLSSLAKQKGFDYPTVNFYNETLRDLNFKSESPQNHNANVYANNRVSAPTLTFIQKWLRDEKRCDITVITNWGDDGVRKYRVGYSYVNTKTNEIDIWFARKDDERELRENSRALLGYDSWELACEVGIESALKRL